MLWVIDRWGSFLSRFGYVWLWRVAFVSICVISFYHSCVGEGRGGCFGEGLCGWVVELKLGWRERTGLKLVVARWKGRLWILAAGGVLWHADMEMNKRK